MLKNLSSKTAFALFLCAISFAALAQNSYELEPEKGIRATVELKNKTISFVVKSAQNTRQEDFLIETEKEVHLFIDDLNFDGKQDFYVSHIDEGKGTYYLQRAFVFSTSKKTYIEVFPRCGDQFIEMKINKRKKTLTSTYFHDNKPRLCTTRLPIKL